MPETPKESSEVVSSLPPSKSLPSRDVASALAQFFKNNWGVVSVLVTTIASIVLGIWAIFKFGFESLEPRFDSVDQRLETVDRRFDNVHKDIVQVRTEMGNEFRAVRDEIQSINNEMRTLNRDIGEIDGRFNTNVTSDEPTIASTTAEESDS